MKRYFFVLIFVCQGIAAQFDAFYPETILLLQIHSAERERVRHAVNMRKFDNQPTGFYIEAGKEVVVNVEILTPSADGAMPFIGIGANGFNYDNRARSERPLVAGENRFTASHSGTLWLGFVSERAADPVGVARITFAQASQHVRVPRYIHGETTNEIFRAMYDAYQSPDVLYHSDYAVVMATRENAATFSLAAGMNPEGVEAWMNGLNRLIELESQISGMNNEDPNPVHHRLKAGQVRFLLVQNTSGSPHASQVYTGYPCCSATFGMRYLRTMGVTSNNWMVAHELGHQHQQGAYLIQGSGESTVNIYSYVIDRAWVERNGDVQFNRTTAQRWQQTQSTYLSLPVSKRIYNMPDSQLEGITGFNRDELRFMIWEQFFLIFGDEFYQTLHRIVREEGILGGGNDERRAYLIWKTSQITGYDMTEFFNQWGIRVTEIDEKELLRARIHNALENGDIATLPRPVNDLLMVTGQNRPDWTPMPLLGIKSSVARDAGLADRTNWTIDVSTDQRIFEAGLGGDDPIYLIDESVGTAFLFIKPGVTFSGATGPPDYIPSFTIDMKEPKEFDFLIYRHRTGNNSEFLRARNISLFGKNFHDDEWEPIMEGHHIDHNVNRDEIRVTFDLVEYRYLHLVVNDWNRSSGSTIQISDFNIGTLPPAENLMEPPPYLFKVTIDAHEGINISTENEFYADEDSELTINFTIDEEYRHPKYEIEVTVDGDVYKTEEEDGVYSINLAIVNHREVSITIFEKTFSATEYTVRIIRGTGISLVTPENASIVEGNEFRATFLMPATFADPTITGGDGTAYIEGNEIIIPSVVSNQELTISASTLTGVSEKMIQAAKVYPNPVKSGQKISIDLLETQNKTTGILKISGADGKLLEHKIISGANEEIEMNYPPGVYFLQLIIDNEETVFKIVVNKW